MTKIVFQYPSSVQTSAIQPTWPTCNQCLSGSSGIMEWIQTFLGASHRLYINMRFLTVHKENVWNHKRGNIASYPFPTFWYFEKHQIRKEEKAGGSPEKLFKYTSAPLSNPAHGMTLLLWHEFADIRSLHYMIWECPVIIMVQNSEFRIRDLKRK